MKALKKLLEPNAKWNEEPRKVPENDINRIEDLTGLSKSENNEELIYS